MREVGWFSFGNLGRRLLEDPYDPIGVSKGPQFTRAAAGARRSADLRVSPRAVVVKRIVRAAHRNPPAPRTSRSRLVLRVEGPVHGHRRPVRDQRRQVESQRRCLGRKARGGGLLTTRRRERPTRESSSNLRGPLPSLHEPSPVDRQPESHVRPHERQPASWSRCASTNLVSWTKGLIAPRRSRLD